MKQLQAMELFNAKIERIRSYPDIEIEIDNNDIDFLKHATNNGQTAAIHRMPRGSGKLMLNLRRMMLCDLYNSIILIKL